MEESEEQKGVLLAEAGMYHVHVWRMRGIFGENVMNGRHGEEVWAGKNLTCKRR